MISVIFLTGFLIIFLLVLFYKIIFLNILTYHVYVIREAGRNLWILLPYPTLLSWTRERKNRSNMVSGNYCVSCCLEIRNVIWVKYWRGRKSMQAKKNMLCYLVRLKKAQHMGLRRPVCLVFTSAERIYLL